MIKLLPKHELNEEAQGWLATLKLRFEPRPNKTVLAAKQQRGPLAVQRPFYPENNVCHLYLLHPPGGVVGGDQLTIESEHKKGSETVITTPGATKFYRSEGRQAKQTQKLTIEDGASLEWLPQENIYFPGAHVQMKTEIDLANDARLIIWETHCLGLPANDEAFDSGELNFELQLHRNGEPLLLEKLAVSAENRNTACGLRNKPVMSTMIASHADQTVLDNVRTQLNDSNELISATLIEDCLIVRFLGDSTAVSRQLLTPIWHLIRPVVMNKQPCPPRIWAT